MESTEKSESSYYSLSYWDRHPTVTQVTHHVVAYRSHSFWELCIENPCMSLGCATPTNFKTEKNLKALPWQHSLSDTPQNLKSALDPLGLTIS